jgi:Tfp pilus assembly protein PilZ
MRVQFRNASSFLVAYTVNLSRGGVFLETEQTPAVGSPITLQLEVPDVGPSMLVVDGPMGIGVEFEEMSESLGAMIDQLVADFGGITVLLVTGDARDRVTITRQLKSIIATAEVVGAADTRVAESVLDDEIDLILADGDGDADALVHMIGAVQALSNPVPIVVMTSFEETRERVKGAGASEILQNPPSFGELQSAVMRALGKPSAVATK